MAATARGLSGRCAARDVAEETEHDLAAVTRQSQVLVVCRALEPRRCHRTVTLSLVQVCCVIFRPIIGHIGQKWDKFWNFSDQISVYFIF